MNLETMISAARALSQGFPFVRVDFYSMGVRVIFGEMTWYPDRRVGAIHPRHLRSPGGGGTNASEAVESSPVRRLLLGMTWPFRG